MVGIGKFDTNHELLKYQITQCQQTSVLKMLLRFGESVSWYAKLAKYLKSLFMFPFQFSISVVYFISEQKKRKYVEQQTSETEKTPPCYLFPGMVSSDADNTNNLQLYFVKK